MPRPPYETHAHEGDVVVFHIGMTVRKPHRPDLWWPAFSAMPRMLGELETARDAYRRGAGEDPGYLGGTVMLGRQGPWVAQYWTDAGKLQAYAADPQGAHLPAWRAFNRRIGKAGRAVGIWHETFVVREGSYETIYAEGVRIGLGAATGTVALGRRGRRAADRLTVPSRA